MIFKTYREHTVKNISTDSILTYSESMRTLDWSNQGKNKNQNWQWQVNNRELIILRLINLSLIKSIVDGITQSQLESFIKANRLETISRINKLK